MVTRQKGSKFICYVCKKHECEEDGAQIRWKECSSKACDRIYHISCLGPTVEKIQGYPYRRWYCSTCVEKSEMRWKVSLEKKRIANRKWSRAKSLSLSRIKQLDLCKVASEEEHSPLEENKAPEIESKEIVSVPPVPSDRRDHRNEITFLALVIFSILISYFFYILYEF